MASIANDILTLDRMVNNIGVMVSNIDSATALYFPRIQAKLLQLETTLECLDTRISNLACAEWQDEDDDLMDHESGSDTDPIEDDGWPNDGPPTKRSFVRASQLGSTSSPSQ